MTHALATPILEALVSHYELVNLVRAHYERTEDPKDTVRKGDVARKLAVLLDIEDSPTFRARVSRAVRDAGWSRAKFKDGFRLYARMRAK